MTGRTIVRSTAMLAAMAPWLLVAGMHAAGGESQGALVHVADTRHLGAFNLYFANLYNVNRVLFTVLSVGMTGAMGLGLGLVMDAVVGAIGLDLSKRQAKE